MSGQTTNQRKDKLQVILDYAPRELSHNNAIKTLQVIDTIAERSHSYTIASPEVVGVFNNCIRSVSKTSDGNILTWEQVVNQHGSIIANFIQKMKDSNRISKVYQPGRYGKSEKTILENMINPPEVDVNSSPSPTPLPNLTRTAKVGDNPNEVVVSSDWNG